MDDFVEAELVVGDGAEGAAAAFDDLAADLAAGGDVPEDHAAVEEIGGVTLAQEIAAALVFGDGGQGGVPNEFLEGREGLQAEDIEAIDDEGVVHVELVDEFHAAEVDFAQGMGEVGDGLDEVVGDLGQLAVGEAVAEDEGVEGDARVALGEAGEGVVQLLGGLAHGDGDDGRAWGGHGVAGWGRPSSCRVAAWMFPARMRDSPTRMARAPQRARRSTSAWEWMPLSATRSEPGPAGAAWRRAARRSVVARSTRKVLRSRLLTPTRRAPAARARSSSGSSWTSTRAARPAWMARV